MRSNSYIAAILSAVVLTMAIASSSLAESPGASSGSWSDQIDTLTRAVSTRFIATKCEQPFSGKMADTHFWTQYKDSFTNHDVRVYIVGKLNGQCFDLTLPKADQTGAGVFSGLFPNLSKKSVGLFKKTSHRSKVRCIC